MTAQPDHAHAHEGLPAIHVIVADANRWATDQLLARATAVLEPSTEHVLRVSRVPGCFELPVACRWALEAGSRGIVVLGAVISDGTAHGAHLADAVATSLAVMSGETGVPIAFGVLTVDTPDEALDRIGTPQSRWDKGRDAALALEAMLANSPRTAC